MPIVQCIKPSEIYMNSRLVSAMNIKHKNEGVWPLTTFPQASKCATYEKLLEEMSKALDSYYKKPGMKVRYGFQN